MTTFTHPTFHRVFAFKKGSFIHVTDVLWKDDDNHGLPQWFFDGDFLSFEVTEPTDVIEWVPAIGPAPCWKAKFSSFKSDEELLSTWDAWFKETY